MVATGTFLRIQNFGSEYFTGLEWSILNALPQGFNSDVVGKFVIVFLIGVFFALVLSLIFRK